jgi:hypothetical protein
MKDGEICICNGVNTEIEVYPYPCPGCGSLTYLGVFIPTVYALYAEWYGWSFQCKNPACAPIYEEDEIDWDDEGNECEPRTVYDLIDYGAYWSE